MAIKVIEKPEELPVSLSELKEHLRILHEDEDTIMEIYLKAASNHIEQAICKRAFVTQTLELVMDNFLNTMEIPRPPLQEVLSVKYLDKDGAEQTIDPENYIVDVDNEPGRIIPAENFSWPTVLYPINAVKVQFKAGYAPVEQDLTANIPEDLKNAILLLAAQLFEFREPILAGTTITELPFAVNALCWPYRIDVL